MIVEDVANYLRDQNLDGIGQNVWAYRMRVTDVGVFVTPHTVGFSASKEIPNFYKGPLQIVVRANTINDAQTQAQLVSDTLSSLQRRLTGDGDGLELPSTSFKYIIPRHYPVAYPRSEGNFWEASVNFDVCFVPLSS